MLPNFNHFFQKDSFFKKIGSLDLWISGSLDLWISGKNDLMFWSMNSYYLDNFIPYTTIHCYHLNLRFGENGSSWREEVLDMKTFIIKKKFMERTGCTRQIVPDNLDINQNMLINIIRNDYKWYFLIALMGIHHRQPFIWVCDPYP